MNKKAKDGHVWVCTACGKRSDWLYGFAGDNDACKCSSGWDESCMLNAVEVPIEEAERAAGGK